MTRKKLTVDSVKVGKKFGHLTVVEAVGKTRGGGIAWLCQCDCGNTVKLNSTEIAHARRTSCGCAATKQKLSLCNNCAVELCDCGWMLSKPSRDIIPWWEERGYKIDVRKTPLGSQHYDIFLVRECPLYSEA